jgi:hypothetical protein
MLLGASEWLAASNGLDVKIKSNQIILKILRKKVKNHCEQLPTLGL